MIELGCCAFSFALGLEDALKLVRFLGFEHVDVGASGSSAQIDQGIAAAGPGAPSSRVRAMAEEVGLTLDELFVTAIQVNGTRVLVNAPDPALRAGFLRRYEGICAFAADAGFRSVMGVPGIVHEGQTQDRAWGLAAEGLSRMVEIATSHGVACHMEPAYTTILETPEAALRMARQVPGLRYTLDYSHYVGQGIGQARVAPLHEFAGHLHAKPARPGLMKAFIAHNTLDWPAIVADLRAREWEGVIATECIGQQFYREIAHGSGPLPAVDSPMSHPVTQTMLTAAAVRAALAVRA